MGSWPSYEKVATDWRGFLICREAPARDPDCLWWTRVRVAGGWLIELAGSGDASALENLLPAGGRVEAVDSALGSRRIVVSTGDRLEAALFVTREGGLPSREWLIGQIEANAPGPAIHYLAGRAPGPQRDQGETICACFNVGAKTIHAAIFGQGLTSVDALGAALGAGTNCGSCRPELARMISERELVDAAQ